MKTWTLFASVLGKKYAFYVAIMGNLLCLFTGMSLAWSSPVLEKLKENDDNPLGNPISETEYGLVGSSFSIGGALGPILLIYSLELLGRKYTILILAAIFPIFHMVLALSKTINLYYISRIACGIAVGGSFSITAIYVGEIVSSKMRGTFMSLGTSFILTGCLLSYSIGPYVPVLYFNIIIAVASFLYIPLFLFSCPESLYYTMQKHGPEKTLGILKRLRKTEGVYDELEDIENSVGNVQRGSVLDIFKTRAGKRAFFLSTTLLIFQQFSGVNVIITYTQTIFKDAEVTIAPEVCTIIVGAFQTATCLITPFAAKKFNRKFLLTISFAGVGTSCAVLGAYFYVDFIHDLKFVPLLSLVSFVIFYNCGVGPLPWVTLGELYPLKVKSVGTAITNTLYWIVQIGLTYFFPSVAMGTSFLVFAGMCYLSIAFVHIFLIETKGKTFQEIQNKLNA